MTKKTSSKDLQQADLSGREYDDMSPEEQAEMKRRFQEFMSAIGASAAAKDAKPKEKEVKKWEPRQAFPKMAKK